jgi:seryl-tRNA synthetase
MMMDLSELKENWLSNLEFCRKQNVLLGVDDCEEVLYLIHVFHNHQKEKERMKTLAQRRNEQMKEIEKRNEEQEKELIRLKLQYIQTADKLRKAKAELREMHYAKDRK